MTLRGPIHGGAHGHPFAASVRDVGAECYLEEEYFLEGTAVPYEWPIGRTPSADGRWRVVEDEPRPFRTRLLIRRPFDPAHFNGCVVVVWTNVTAGFEVLEWETDESLNGCAWAFVSAQHVGVHGLPGATNGGLVGWDPERYGELHVDHDDLSYDIFTQAAEAVGPHRAPPHRPEDVDPLGGLEVQYVIAAGSSQSAARLATYRNAIQPRTEAFDAFFLDLWFGTAAPLGDDPLMQGANDPASLAARETRLRRGETLLRDDLDVVTMVFLSESEMAAYTHVSQPDDPQLRVWEVAGASHFSQHTLVDMNAKTVRDLGAPFAPDPRAGAHLNGFDERPARDAALRGLREWVVTGEPPPEQPRLVIDRATGEVARDAWGLACGGIRLPEIDVPLAVHRGTNDLPGLASISGSTIASTRAEIHERFADRASYVAAYERAARAAYRAGVLLPRERDRMVAEARARDLW